MTNNDKKHRLGEEEKKKKQEEIAKRLAEIKNKLTKQVKPPEKSAKKTAEPDPAKKEKPGTPAKSQTTPPVGTKVTVTPPHTPPPKTGSKKDVKVINKSTSPPEKIASNRKEVSFKIETSASTDEKKWSANQPKEKKTKSNIEIKPVIPKKSKKNRRFLLLVSISSLLVIGFTLWFLLQPTATIQEVNPLEPSIAENPNKSNKDGIQETETKDQLSSANATMDTDRENESMQETVVQTSTSSKTPVDKWGLSRPCYVISYLATKDEQNALSLSTKLTDQGLPAGYYWIPDYLEGGPSLYKVYLGPFSSKAKASEKLKQIHSMKKDAYVQYVE